MGDEGYIEMTETTSLNMRQWQAFERPRERLLRHGAGHLAVAELLAVCFGSGRPGQDAIAFARSLLSQFGSLDAVLQAPQHELLKVKGLGAARVALLKALHELTLRHCEEGMRDQALGAQAEPMSDVGVVSRYLQRKLGYAQSEVFACMYLDNRHRLLAYEAPFQGSVNRAYVFPRLLLRRSLELNAAAVIFAHNHPSGVAEPSQADIALTRDLCELFAKIDIRVLDHFVIAAQNTVSMAGRGLLSP